MAGTISKTSMAIMFYYMVCGYRLCQTVLLQTQARYLGWMVNMSILVEFLNQYRFKLVGQYGLGISLLLTFIYDFLWICFISKTKFYNHCVFRQKRFELER